MIVTVNDIMLGISMINSMNIGDSLPYKTARELYKMKRILNEEFDFANQEYRKLLNKHHGIETDKGDIQFDTPESCRAFQADESAIRANEVELGISVIDLSKYSDSISFRGNIDFDILEKFIRFE